MKKDYMQEFAKAVDDGVHLNNAADWSGTQESLELLELGRALAGQDYSKAHKAAVLAKVQSRTQHKQEAQQMKIKTQWKRPAMVMASLLVAGALSVSLVKPSYAQELLGRVLQSINLGNIIVHEMDTAEMPDFPKELEGKLFDKDGNVITADSKKVDEIYNAAGEQIVNFEGDQLITKSEQEQRDKEAAERIVAVKSRAELDQYAMFKVKLPEYLPEGFAFDRGEFYKSEDGVNGKYLDLFFSSEHKGQDLKMHFRYSDKETAYEMSFDGKVEPVKLNGVDAVMMDDRNLDWEADGVLYNIVSHGLDRAEVLKIAESLR
ncbi:hypothetical protein R70723_05455 [Paenibacillus sp. FSL R7-0273]|uniref:DUF4367 domain-containing protein n=1 Tax=Paenibacillus sp. FSL R7-0273 TaxID=1536772 RepID=UPI0004F8233B|nr:DUF4367 domain-containing protein [Paenibacillus sp. FSL R7-0273]AIQ45405.1 hypothetical protein R70723_05455 [Paenibacillus sp. FSL R7-0273]OMF89968.1 hypothetical protein BK144_18435 [Paenibacillus sp. FSL R7-0273]